MFTKHIYKFSTIIFLLALLLPGLAAAQSAEPTLASLTVEIWPEYDRPDTLVIYRAELSEDTPLPATLVLRFPPYIESMHAVAIEKDGRLITPEENALRTNSTADALEVILNTNDRKIQMEYYDPQILSKQGQDRQLDFSFAADYPVDNAIVQIQEPIESSNFTVTPAAGNKFADSNGLNYQRIDIAGLAAGDTVDLSASYSRATDIPTVELISANTPEHAADTGDVTSVEVGTNTASESGGLPIGYLLVGAGIVLLLATGGYWWWSNRTQPAPATVKTGPQQRAPRKKRRVTAADSRPKNKPAAGGGYCHQCGTALRADSKFCHVCGAARRT
ncbi:MAG: zinc ribbon domain-containing protein [Chloroflexi bacterium]|nr:MAG: zinc ribbon domain-containing protein [Chloroflexota bacterium]